MEQTKKIFLSLFILLLNYNFANAKKLNKKSYITTIAKNNKKFNLNQLINEFFRDNKKIFTDEDLDKFYPKIYHEINTNNPNLYIILEKSKYDINKAKIRFSINERKKTLWVFSSEESLINATSKTANKNPNFTIMPISEVMQFCDKFGIEKIIIDELIPLHKTKNGD